jgi:hypothetical protein
MPLDDSDGIRQGRRVERARGGRRTQWCASAGCTARGKGNVKIARGKTQRRARTTTALCQTHVGTYAITCTGAGDGNHAIAYQAGSLHILAAPLYVGVQSKSVTYGKAPGAIKPLYLGLVGGDTAASLTTPASCVTTATRTSHAGGHAAGCYGAADTDYSISYYPGRSRTCAERWS